MKEWILARIKQLKTEEGKEPEIMDLEKHLKEIERLQGLEEGNRVLTEEITKKEELLAKAEIDKEASIKLLQKIKNETKKEKIVDKTAEKTVEQIILEDEIAKEKARKENETQEMINKIIKSNEEMTERLKRSEEVAKLEKVKNQIINLKVEKPFYKEILDKIDLNKEGVTESEITSKFKILLELHKEEDLKKKYESEKNKGKNPYLNKKDEDKLNQKKEEKSDMELKLEKRRKRFLQGIR